MHRQAGRFRWQASSYGGCAVCRGGSQSIGW
ncbi:hypothetical protein [Pseudomonas protegens]